MNALIKDSFFGMYLAFAPFATQNMGQKKSPCGAMYFTSVELAIQHARPTGKHQLVGHDGDQYWSVSGIFLGYNILLKTGICQ